MGVPKFYRWLSERYPCLSEVVREYQIPEFDNLYLDMNGIIHLCSHPNDDDPHFRITEEKIFSDIFHYLECLFRLIKPKKVFFMAVDGVAPRAKMNQQRGRRFRSAREAQDSEKRAIQRGEKLPEEERFDSNCITPGTEFMVKLQEQLKYFVNSKTPGEGEHKIMDFIRYEKSQPDYDPNTRHCLYGLDADLIMLGLCTHEPHFSLLREEVRFGGKKSQKRIPTAEETTFHLLHLSLLREYLEHEFSAVKSMLPFPFDLEKVVDDWVLMGFLVGNDFIPNLPNMHIVHGALPTLYQAYRDVLPTLNGYINEGGYLNLERFEKYIQRLSQVDYEHFNDSYADFKWLESKRETAASNGAATHWQSKSRNRGKPGASCNPFAALENIDADLGGGENVRKNEKKDATVPVGILVDIENGAEAGEDFFDKESDEEIEDEEEELFQLEFTHLKRDYYMNKLNYAQVTQDVLRDQAECFVRAIQWNLHYYYNGVCSWSWYYPHHYAPYMSDIKNFANLKLDFDLGKPFLPFQQLLAVLPSASKSLLPKPYQNLMCNFDSPVIDYYPAEFQTDLNGKQQDWEAVVLIPFIDETRLLEAMELETTNLTLGESIRNKHGPCLLYTYSETPLGGYPSSLPGKYPDIDLNHTKCTEIPIDGFRVSPEQLCKGLCPGVRLDVYFPGFPTLKHIPHTARFKKAEVKVFQMNSRGDNMILTMETRFDLGLRKAAEEFLGRLVYVSWPHLMEAKIETVSNINYRCRLNSKNEISQEDMSKDEANIWQMESSAIQEMYFKRWGVEIGDTTILVHAKPLIGRKYTCAFGGKVTLEKQWATRSVPYALQTIVKDIQVQDSSFTQYRTLDDLFPVDSTCFMLGTPNYGCMGKAMKVDSKKKGYIQISFEVWPDPNLDAILRQFTNTSNRYMEGYKACQGVGISGYLFSRITTTFYVKIGNRNTGSQRANIGLNLKFNKKNEEVAGFTKKEGEKWLYSSSTVDVVNMYLQRFPEMFDYLSRNVKQDNIYTDDMLEGSGATIQDVQAFLKSLPTHSLEHQRCGSEAVEETIIKQIETAIDQFYTTACSKQVVMQVRPHLLYKPNSSQGCMAPDPTAQYQLFDRIVNTRDGYSVPLGLRGTVIGIQSAEKEADTVYEILLDKEIRDGLTLRCSPNRGYRLPAYSLINLSHALRADHRNRKPMAVVHPQTSKPNGSLTFENSAWPKSPGKGRVTIKQNAHITGLDAANQPTKQGAQGSPQVIYPNTLNHSPNSPFVVQQPHLLANRPQFVTPKLQTSSHQWTPRQPIANQWQVQGHEPQQDSEFQQLWKQLQSSGSSAPPNHGPEFAKSSSTLLQAAKSLPKHNAQAQRNRNAQRNPADVNEFPEQSRQGPPPMPAFASIGLAADPKPGGEFNNMLQALTRQNRAPGTVAAKNDPTSLLRNMQIGDSDERSKQLPLQTPTKGQDFVGKLTVEQLFKETRESEMRAKQMTTQKPESRTKMSRDLPSGVRDKTAAQQSNAVSILMNMVQKRCGGIPCYDYVPVQQGATHLVRASVRLPDGDNFFGLACASKEEAAESAAHTALVKSKYNSSAPHRGHVAARMGPQSVAQVTGAPVRLAGLMPQHIPAGIMPSRMPHQALAHAMPYSAFPQGNQFFPPAQMYQRPYYGHPYSLDPRFQAQMRLEFLNSQVPPHEGQRNHPRPPNVQKAANKFEPLQVTKQKMTPKKGSGKELVGVDLSHQNPATRKTEAYSLDQPGPSDSASSTHSSKEQVNNKTTGGANQRARQKKKKSRLAINFQAAGK